MSHPGAAIPGGIEGLSGFVVADMKCCSVRLSCQIWREGVGALDDGQAFFVLRRTSFWLSKSCTETEGKKKVFFFYRVQAICCSVVSMASFEAALNLA